MIERIIVIICILIFGISDVSANWQSFGGDVQYGEYLAPNGGNISFSMIDNHVTNNNSSVNIPIDIKINPLPNIISNKLKISGTAYSPNDILVVTVNGKNAGTINWNKTLTLSNGVNNVTIAAVDKAGNIKTKYMTVTLNPVKVPGFEMLNVIESIMVIYLFKRFDGKHNRSQCKY